MLSDSESNETSETEQELGKQNFQPEVSRGGTKACSFFNDAYYFKYTYAHKLFVYVSFIFGSIENNKNCYMYCTSSWEIFATSGANSRAGVVTLHDGVLKIYQRLWCK